MAKDCLLEVIDVNSHLSQPHLTIDQLLFQGGLVGLRLIKLCRELLEFFDEDGAFMFQFLASLLEPHLQVLFHVTDGDIPDPVKLFIMRFYNSIDSFLENLLIEIKPVPRRHRKICILLKFVIEF